MNEKNYTYYWKPASRREVQLIRIWEENALKQHMSGAFIIILLLTLPYIMITSQIMSSTESIWKPVLLYLVILAAGLIIFGIILYEDEKELWGSRLYTRTVTCIGHTEINTRYSASFSLDIIGEEGEILEQVKVQYAVLKAVRHQDMLLAVTNDPRELMPIRLVPFTKPVKSSFLDMDRF